MGRKEDNIKKAQFLVHKKEKIRNIGTAAHIDHGKTTLSDSLIAGAGMISEELAGQQLFMDFDEQEQARGITINAAIASMVHDHEGDQYLINLIDTPGHVDFGGDVTRAMRAIDGVIILVDGVEGVMPQTETVIRQALKERVKPVLFINKVDRLVNELKITPEQMQQRLTKIITDVNARILKLLPDELKETWSLNVETGTVAFGSAFHKWAISVPFMKRTGIKFADVYKHCQEGTMKELSKKAPLHQIVLTMVIKHLPNPLEAQKIRIPVIWKGDLESAVGKAMLGVAEKRPVVTISSEAKSTQALPKLIEVLRLIAKADPSIQVEINQETGEHLVSGMGELHLEITIYRVQNDYKVPVVTSTPIVVYREGVADRGGPFEGKSPNKHNRFYFEVEPLAPAVVVGIRAGGGRPLGGQAPKKPHPLLLRGGAARARGRGRDPRGRDCLRDADQGL